MRAKACSDGECRRLYKNERMRDYLGRRKAQDGQRYEDRYKVPVQCAECGETFYSRHGRQGSLPQACKPCNGRRILALPGVRDTINAGRRAAASERRASRLPVPLFGPPSPYHGQTTQIPASHPARQDWSKSTGLTYVGGRCRRCGETFLAAFGNGVALYCSRSCIRMDAKDRRRAKTPGEVPPARRWFVFERDRWVCQLCGKLIPKRYRDSTHHPLSPTIDHILPVDLGGNHQEWNLQAAHRQCNSEKSNRTAPGGDQLRLAV